MNIVDRLAAALAATALLVPAAAAAAAPTHGPPAQPTRFTVEVEGKGPDVILIPGLSSSREVWNGARGALAGRYRLHPVQLNGFAGSAPGPNAQGRILAGTVDELKAYIETRRLRRPAIVGHSLGGLLALMLADAAPKDVGRLMIVDALPFIGTLFDPKATVASVEPQAARIRDMMAAPATAEQRAKGAGQVGAGLAKSPEAQALVARWVTASDPKVSGIATYEDMTTDMRTALPRIAAPITIVYAYDPPMLPEARAKTVFEDGYAGARRVRFVPVEGSRHFVMLDRPAAFEAALNGFLAGR